MWAAIKKAINSNLSRPLNVYIDEMHEIIVGEDVIGVQWDQSADETLRLGNVEGRADFDYLPPWSNLKRCILKDDKTVAYYLDPYDSSKKENGEDANLDGSDGQVMVEIPKFYYRAEKQGSTYRYYVSPGEKEGYEVHPAFIRDGVEKDYIYFAAFEGFYNSTDDKMESIIDVVPSTDDGTSDEGYTPIEPYPEGHIADVRSKAQNRGAGWEQRDFLTTCAIQLLLLVEYASFDSQGLIGRGVVDKESEDNNNAEKTGATVNLGNQSGMADGDDGLTSISYRGIENFWGNIWEWTDGLNLNDYEAFIADHNFESDKFDGHYQSIGTVLSTSDTYIKDIIFNGADFTFLASEGGGSSSSYLHSNWWINDGQKVARFGGRWTTDSLAGGFCWALSYDSTNSSRSIGGRLLCIP